MILCIDGSNFLHRSRAGLNVGDHYVCFNFFRSLRAIVGMFEPNRVYFVLDGAPVQRRNVFPDYKANRKIDAADTTRIEEMQRFYAQCNLIIELLRKRFPVSVVHHADHEADDIIYNLIKRGSKGIDWTVASNDSDFIQLLDNFENVSVYNPMKKKYVFAPTYDYVLWKSLRGDPSDNIPGIPGIGDKRAEKLVSDLSVMKKFLSESPSRASDFARNHDLIKFIDISIEDMSKMTSSEPTRDWDDVRAQFDEWKFASITNEESWKKFVTTFDVLWNSLD